jgi:hypothetical protein
MRLNARAEPPPRGAGTRGPISPSAASEPIQRMVGRDTFRTFTVQIVKPAVELLALLPGERDGLGRRSQAIP